MSTLLPCWRSWKNRSRRDSFEPKLPIPVSQPDANTSKDRDLAIAYICLRGVWKGIPPRIVEPEAMRLRLQPCGSKSEAAIAPRSG